MALIGEGAFQKCISLINITFDNPSNLVEIGKYTFKECSSITQLSFPASVINVGFCAFNDCNSLVQIAIPCVKTIGTSVFNGCFSLKEVYLHYSNAVKSIGLQPNVRIIVPQ